MDGTNFYNLNLGEKKVSSEEELNSEKLTISCCNFASVYDLQKSASEWLWCDFSWFQEEQRYREIIYQNSVPVYKLVKK
jgi:hypothetical protein